MRLVGSRAAAFDPNTTRLPYRATSPHIGEVACEPRPSFLLPHVRLPEVNQVARDRSQMQHVWTRLLHRCQDNGSNAQCLEDQQRCPHLHVNSSRQRLLCRGWQPPPRDHGNRSPLHHETVDIHVYTRVGASRWPNSYWVS